MKSRLVKMMLIFLLLCMSYSVVYADTMQLIYDGETHFYENDPITLYIDGKLTVTTVMPPIQFDGAVVVPAREVFSTMGATVEWRASEQSVYVHDDYNLIVLKINSQEAWVNETIQSLMMPAKLINDKVMVPIRFISETLGYKVKWVQSERAIYIETKLDSEIADEQVDEKEDEAPDDDELIPDIEVGDNEGMPDIEEGENNFSDDSIADPWFDSKYIHYLDEEALMILSNMEGLTANEISIDDNYRDRQIVIHLNKDYRSYLPEGRWIKETGVVKEFQITHQNMETQIILTTHTIQALNVSMQGSDIHMKLVKPSEKYAKVIVLDAGHGAHDGGTTYGNIKEKDLTLSISNAVLEKLQSNSELKVYATREEDVFLELMQRAEFANEINPDLFISIHINSVQNTPAASGTETYYTEKTDTRNKIFATMVQEGLVNEFGTKNRGVKTNTFVVTRYTNAPAILIEIGFLTNESDRAMMLSPDFTTRYANVIYNCIMEYYANGYDY